MTCINAGYNKLDFLKFDYSYSKDKLFMIEQKSIAISPGDLPPAALPSKGSAMFIIGVLFFVFGFVTWLNGLLIPFLKMACQLETDLQAFFVTFAFYMA